MTEAAKTKAPDNAACRAMTERLGLDVLRRLRNSTSSNIPAGIAGRMYPGSLDCEMEKNAIVTPIQISRNAAQVVGVAISKAPNGPHASGDDKHCRGDPSQKSDGDVVPERLGVVIKIGAEAGEVVFDDEFVEKLRIAELHHHVPRQADCAEEKNPGQPERFPDDLRAALGGCEDCDDDDSKRGSDRAFGEHRDGDERIKRREMAAAPAFEPCVPTEHCDGERDGQWQVHGRGAGVADDSRGTGQHQRALEFESWAEAAKEEIDGEYQREAIDRRRQSRCPIADTENLVRDHCLPVIEWRFFQPRAAAQDRCDPVMAGQHFAGDLRIAWLIRADQAERTESPEKKESAECAQKEPVGDAVASHRGSC